jgi:hypothetical protein
MSEVKESYCIALVPQGWVFALESPTEEMLSRAMAEFAPSDPSEFKDCLIKAWSVMLHASNTQPYIAAPLTFSTLDDAVAFFAPTAPARSPPPLEPISEVDFNTAISQHLLWLGDNEQGKRADFSGKDLRGKDLRCLNLRQAIFKGADLSGVNMSYSICQHADFTKAKFSKTTTAGTDFSYAVGLPATVQNFKKARR